MVSTSIKPGEEAGNVMEFRSIIDSIDRALKYHPGAISNMQLAKSSTSVVDLLLREKPVLGLAPVRFWGRRPPVLGLAPLKFLGGGGRGEGVRVPVFATGSVRLDRGPLYPRLTQPRLGLVLHKESGVRSDAAPLLLSLLSRLFEASLGGRSCLS